MEEVLLLIYSQQNIFSFAPNKEKDNFWWSEDGKAFCFEK